MAAEYPHLEIQRLEPVNPRRRRQGGPRVEPPENPRAHAHLLTQQINRTEETLARQHKGFDPRLLMKLRLEGIEPDELRAIRGLEVVSQEGRNLVVLFASHEGLTEFRRRLAILASGRRPTRQDILFAVKEVGWLTEEDRTGPALRAEGVPDAATFSVDVELWPLENRRERAQMLEYFARWFAERQVRVIDSVNQETIVLYRVLANRDTLKELLTHRDVRLVDLPPRFQFDFRLTALPLENIPPVPTPPAGAPGVVVLDSGLITGHPLLAPAVGDAQSFVPGAGADDEAGHGTMVAGLALYGDVWKCAEQGRFVPQLRLFSGRVTDAAGEYEEGFIENRIAEAVRYFVEHYGCRVFNISLGDERKPFTGGHVRGLAAVLDTLAREHRVLFVISAGNFNGVQERPRDWLREYPDYLFEETARIIDPAPAINALTVGSLARSEVPRMAARFDDPAYQPVARLNQPSPFTRSGPGPGGAFKPEVVEYGGNYYVNLRVGNHVPRGSNELGELSTSREFTEHLFSVSSGTSYAAPKVAHLAGLVWNTYPTATPELVRALIVAHASHPRQTAELLERDEERILRLIGYGKPDWEAVLRSSQNLVTLFSQEEIEEDQHHFYEIPLPEDFRAPPVRRLRRITVALAHTPLVRRTRIEYKGSAISFRVVRNSSLQTVANVFRRTGRDEREELIPETGHFRPTAVRREKGTVQAATWNISQTPGRYWDGQRLFVVVTRSVPAWAEGRVSREPYALVIVLEDSAEVRYYTQIQQLLRVRVRV